jgi:hypothetical protein
VTRRGFRRAALGCAAASLLWASAAVGQTADTVANPQTAAPTSPWDYRGLEMSRASLEQLLTQYDAVVSSSVYSERLREDARAAAARIRERLELGDFRSGDRIVVDIEGETQRSDTVAVDADQHITIQGMERISLAGVLRSELQPHLERAIGKFIKAPKVLTASLIRLILQGSIMRPGLYVVPAKALLEDVIQQAGGMAPTVALDDIRIERDGTVLLEGAEVRQALVDGLSVDQLNLRAGDQITFPASRPGGSSSTWSTIGRYVLMIAAPLLLGVRMVR